MRIRVLGPPEVDVDGVGIPLAGRRQQALLALLVMHANTVVSVSRMAEALWDDQPPEAAVNAVQTVVSRLRRLLGVHDAIVTSPAGYMLEIDDAAIDARRFEVLCHRARAQGSDDPASAAALLDEALGLWRGRPYGAFADTFARSEAIHLEELRIAALEQRAVLALALGAADDAVARSSALVAAHPLREGPVQALMRALHAAGRTADALAAYRRHRETVGEELGLAPSPALRDLEGRILRDELETAPTVTPALASTRPPPSGPRARLPWRPSPLVGREVDLAALRGALDECRLVTLVGPGGVGKTRLALEVAHQAVEAGASVGWVDLVGVAPARVVHAVASGLDVEIARDDDPAGQLCATLATHQVVVCLDNAEHLLDPLALLVERVVDEAAGVRMLVTSRERLAIDAETVHVVSPLPVSGGAAARADAAVRLYLERWRGASVDDVTDDEVALVADVCRRLDGLPLAIELAAARTPALGLRAVADRLARRLDLLTGGRRTSADRHRTLRAVVDWSHRLLQEAEAVLFARLAVFPANFTLHQVETVCAGDGLEMSAIAPLLSRLADQSLVQVGPDGFWLLETLRTYASERLSGADRRWLAANHARDTARRLSAAAQQLWTPNERDAVAAVDALVPDLHAAWAYAIDHDVELAVGLAADVFGFAYLRQRLDVLRWSLALADRDLDHPRMPDVLAAAAVASWSASELDRAHRLADRGVDVAGGPAEPAAAEPLDVSADLAMFEGRVEEAVARYRAVARLRAPSVVGVLLADIAAAQALAYGADWREAQAEIDELIERAHATRNPTTLAFAYFTAGELAAHGDAGEALRAYARAIEHGTPVDCRLFVMIARSAAAALRVVDGALEQVVAECTDLLDEWERLDNAAGHWSALQMLVVVLARVGAYDAAALVAGAVYANLGSTWRFPRSLRQLDEAARMIRDRLTTTAADAGMARGARLSRADATAVVRAALGSKSD